MVRRSARRGFCPTSTSFRAAASMTPTATRQRVGCAATAGDVDPAYAMTAARETFEEVGLLFADRAGARRGARRIAARDARGRDRVRRRARTIRRVGRRVAAALFLALDHAEGGARHAPVRRALLRCARAGGPGRGGRATEVLDGRWIAPADALAANARGEIELIFPTIKHLERIAPYRTVDELLAFARHEDDRDRVARRAAGTTVSAGPGARERMVTGWATRG